MSLEWLPLVSVSCCAWASIVPLEERAKSYKVRRLAGTWGLSWLPLGSVFTVLAHASCLRAQTGKLHAVKIYAA